MSLTLATRHLNCWVHTHTHTTPHMNTATQRHLSGSILDLCLSTSTGISSHRLYMKPPPRFVCVSHRCNDKVPLDFTSKINRISGCLTAATLFLCHSLYPPNPPALCFLLQSVPRFLNPTLLTHSPSFISTHPNTVCPKRKNKCEIIPSFSSYCFFSTFFLFPHVHEGQREADQYENLTEEEEEIWIQPSAFSSPLVK